jgi:DNA-binding GntR family transcriptional regulator
MAAVNAVTDRRAEIDAYAHKIGGRKADRAYDIIKRAILLRRYPPEAQLLEQSLAAEFACSQGTVREALLRLAEDGLVERRGYQGTVVTDTSLAEAVEMVRVRLSVERGVARVLAGIDIGPARVALERLIGQMDDAHAADDLYRCSELDRAFHSQLARTAGMGQLSPIVQRCALHIHRFTLSSVDVPGDFFKEAGVGAEHRMLLAELTKGSPIRAERAVAVHLARVLSRCAPSLYAALGEDAFVIDG